MATIQWIGIVLGVVLQLLLLSALLRGHYRQYPFLLILIISEFLTTVVGTAATIDLGKWTTESAKYYWIGETLQYVLIFACQAHLLYQTMSKDANRGRLFYVIACGLLYAVLSTWFAYDPKMNTWMTQLIRNFNFGGMLLNMLLWTMLLRRPERSRLLITAGFGIQLAGWGIGHSLRQLAPMLVKAGNVILLVCYLLFLLTIWRGVSAPPVQLVRRTPEEDLAPQPEHKPA